MFTKLSRDEDTMALHMRERSVSLGTLEFLGFITIFSDYLLLPGSHQLTWRDKCQFIRNPICTQLIRPHCQFVKVALAVYLTVFKLMLWILISINIPNFCRSVKLHHLLRPGTIGKLYWKIIKYFVWSTQKSLHQMRVWTCMVYIDEGHSNILLSLS